MDHWRILNYIPTLCTHVKFSNLSKFSPYICTYVDVLLDTLLSVILHMYKICIRQMLETTWHCLFVSQTKHYVLP